MSSSFLLLITSNFRHDELCMFTNSHFIHYIMATKFYYKIHRAKVQNLNRHHPGPCLLFADLWINRTAVLQRFGNRITYLKYFYIRPTDFFHMCIYALYRSTAFEVMNFLKEINETLLTLQKNLYHNYER